MTATLRVLYAEDNALDADLTRAHISEFAPDIEVEIVDTGHACLERLHGGDCDVLLLDHHLPDMDGLDVLKTAIRAGTPAPIVLVTGVGDESLVVKALRLGAASYVPKQGNYVETLPNLIRSVVQEHRLARSRGMVASGSRRILYIEHHEMDIELTLRHFAEVAPEFEIEVVHTCADALNRLTRPPPPDVTLVDLRMPDQSGLDFAREARRRGLPLLPFLMVSGRGDEAAAIASLKLGAAEYVVKREGYLDQLPTTIDRVIAYHRLDRLTERLGAELAERKGAEEALRESEARFRQVFERSPIGKAMTSLDGKIIRVNQAFADMLGRSVEEMQQLPFETVTHADDVAEGWFASRCLVAGERPTYPMEKRYFHRDGHLVYAEVSAALFCDSRGSPFCFLTTIVDITARKRIEAERAKLEEQLAISQRMEAIGSLAGGIAHDFNNLLSVILGYTEFAMEGTSAGDPRREALLEVKKAGERAAALTRQLLAFGRKQMLQPVLLDLNQIAAGLEKMLRRILGEDIEYIQVLAPDAGVVWADPGQIEQVFMNLVVNARDAMPDGGMLTVETANVQIDEEYARRHVAVKPGPYVRLAITDTGCGMDAETRARIFEPFFTTKAKGKGTGLGLSTVYGIVKQSGGNIWAYSEKGRGTTFKIYLPRVSPAAVPEPSIPPVVTRHAGTETILVVEDEQAVRDLAARILRLEGYTVLTAATGHEALEVWAAHEGRVDLVLTDVVMPHMGGRALIEHLAARAAGIKALYMSGYADDAIVHHGTLDPGTHFIGKPFAAADLARKVREVLSGAEGGGTG
ncbi:MAG: response regulator [Polyangiaceae bacterium]|jgi:PAS domain S-box-containing protein